MFQTLFNDELRRRNLSVRQAAREIGVSYTTIEHVTECRDIDPMLICMGKWLNVLPSHVLMKAALKWMAVRKIGQPLRLTLRVFVDGI